jgi:hypothetical protein
MSFLLAAVYCTLRLVDSCQQGRHIKSGTAELLHKYQLPSNVLLVPAADDLGIRR